MRPCGIASGRLGTGSDAQPHPPHDWLGSRADPSSVESRGQGPSRTCKGEGASTGGGRTGEGESMGGLWGRGGREGRVASWCVRGGAVLAVHGPREEERVAGEGEGEGEGSRWREWRASFRAWRGGSPSPAARARDRFRVRVRRGALAHHVQLESLTAEVISFGFAQLRPRSSDEVIHTRRPTLSLPSRAWICHSTSSL